MKYEFIGWEYDEKENHDKVWGVICIDSNDDPWANRSYVSFWGRRGRKLSTKVYQVAEWEMRKVWEKKNREGYTRIHEARLAEVYPEFQEDLEKTAIWATLKL